MNTISLSFLITTLAGLSTTIGVLPIFIKLKNEIKIIAASLAFASGVMICVSITDLVPESISMLGNNYNGVTTCFLSFLFIMIGMFLSNLIDNKLQSNTIGVPLYKVGIISMFAIILHNIPEDCRCYVSQ